MMSISSTYLPPLFTSLGDNIFEDDLDMDFKMLSEYLFDDQILNMPNGAMPNSKKSQAKKKSKSLDNISNDTSVNDINMDSDGDDFSGDEDEEDFKLDASKHQRVDKRRERNRVLARKTRLRKKFFFESLQRQVAQLTKENEMLKGIAKQNLKPETLHKILSDCSELPACVVASTQQANSILEKADYKLMAAIQAAQRSFCISDPSLPDNPIVFASAGFLELTGYTLDQVIGRNCRFLQGPKTDPSQVEILKKGIVEGNDTSVCIINYKADGTEFHNQVFVAALRDENHKIVNYVGVQVEIKYKLLGDSFLNEEELNERPAKKGRPRTKGKELASNANASASSSSLVSQNIASKSEIDITQIIKKKTKENNPSPEEIRS